MQKTFRLFRHYWDNEYHKNWTFNKSTHYIRMLEFTPYFTKSGEKRVKLEWYDFTEDARWKEVNGEPVWVSTWNREQVGSKDFSRDEANAEWVKAKNVKYVTQRIPKEIASLFKA